jgi:ATP-dependent Clp protease protease subunit
VVGRERPALIEALKRRRRSRGAPAHQQPGRRRLRGARDGRAIVAHPGTVTSHIDGLAASAATYLALAANEVRMTDGGLFMIHNSWTLAWGDKSELRSTADLLEKIDGTIARRLRAQDRRRRRPGRRLDGRRDLVHAAAEALDAGFIDAIDAEHEAR